VDSAVDPRIRAQFEAIVLEPLLSGVERAFGPYGEMAAQPFQALLAQELERQQ
jgi:hypothetical protein